MHIGIQNLLSREQNINASQYKTYLDKFDNFLMRSQEKGLKASFRPITEQQFVEFTKMLPSDWLRKYFSINIIRINKLNAFTGQLPTKN